MTIFNGHEGPVMEISAAKFKARCLKLMDDVGRTRRAVTITKRGKPIARLVPVEAKARRPIFGYMAETISHMGDLTAPLDVEWEAQKAAGPGLLPSPRKRPRR